MDTNSNTAVVNPTTLSNGQVMEYFLQGSKVVFSRWTALNLAIENYWGGRHTQRKVDTMYNTTIEMFAKGRVYVDELQELFYDTFENGFHMVAEDGSVEEVSKLLVSLYDQLSKSDLTMFTTLVNAKVTKGTLQSIKQTTGDEDDEDSEEEDEDDEDEESTNDVAMEESTAPEEATNANTNSDTKSNMEEDDGWTVVKKGGRRK